MAQMVAASTMMCLGPENICRVEQTWTANALGFGAVLMAAILQRWDYQEILTCSNAAWIFVIARLE